MEKFNKLINLLKARLLVIAIILMVLVGIFHYAVFYFQTYQANDNINRVDSVHTEAEWDIIESVIYFAKFQAKTNSDIAANNIINGLRESYPDLSELSNEFAVGMQYSPKFLSIISKGIKDCSMYDMHNSKNDIFVLSRNGIILDNNIQFHNATHRSIHDEVKTHYNQILGYKAIDMLIDNNKSDIIFYEPNEPIRNIEHMVLNSPSIEGLKNVYTKEGIEGLSGYVMLVPSYITETGDIFGTPDISSDGNVNKTYKIVVVQRFSLYDILKKHQLVTHTEDDLCEVAKAGYSDMLKASTISYVCITLLDLIALCFLMIIATGKDDKIKRE